MYRRRWTWVLALLALLAGAAWANGVDLAGHRRVVVGFVVSLVVAEAVAVLVEAGAYAEWADWTWRQALRGSLVCNVASFVLGTSAAFLVGRLMHGEEPVAAYVAAFAVTVCVETILASQLARRWGESRVLAERVCLLTHCVSWPVTVGIQLGLAAALVWLVMGVWVIG
jgi:hypothetical protein